MSFQVLFACAPVLALLCSCGADDDNDAKAPGAPTSTSVSTNGAATTAPATTTATGERPSPTPADPGLPRVQSFPVARGTHPHDVAPARDGGVWYTAQATGKLGWLDSKTGETWEAPLGAGSAPHGVIVGPDGAPWITDGGLNAIVRVDPVSRAVSVFPLPATAPRANLNTAVFDARGTLWFTGQAGYYGRLKAGGDKVEAWAAPRGSGPYGITATPDGRVFYASLAGSHIAEINTETGQATVIEPPTKGQGARRVWSDSKGNIWVSEWNAGQVARYDPVAKAWKEWKLPGGRPQAYAVYVDERDIVWLTDFSANNVVSFDPATEKFQSYELSGPNSAVRQLLGREGEVWGAESGLDRIIVFRAR